ncbi:QRFP-like peptide receptor [Mercenaria mercenaria]|uniref:QRFP-like peptide receptor n=1 Tax=Mercenaria mercenaria TaxID=6596 RepID=UPI00234E5E02|nr:QRFP-like peptide receptor [Mercenaria mercenaria]
MTRQREFFDGNATFSEDDLYGILHANVDYVGDFNFLLPDDGDFLLDDMSRTMKTILCVLYSLLSVGAFAGNACILIVIIAKRSLRTVTNTFILSLAVSDILIAGWNMPLQLLFHLNNEWTFGETMCKLTSFIQGVGIITSILALSAIAIERYHVICNPIKARYIRSTKSAVFLTVTIWTTAILVMLPHLWIQRLQQRLSWQHEKYPPIRIAYLCVEYFPKFSYNVCYSFGFFFIFYVLPVSVMTFAYGKMANVLWVRTQIGEPLTQTQLGDKRELQKRNIIRMLIVIVLCYIICWLPFFAVHIVILFCEFTNTVRIIQAFALLFGYSNAFVNALIYFFLNAKFNQLIKEKLGQLCNRSSKDRQFTRKPTPLLSRSTSV